MTDNNKPGVLAVMDARIAALAAKWDALRDVGDDGPEPPVLTEAREARATVEQMADALAKIVHDWDGEPEDMLDAIDALAAFRGEQP